MARQRYSPEYKQEAVTLVQQSGIPISEIARNLGILGLSVRPIPHEFKTQHLPYREYYTERSRKLVSVTYEADIDFLKYTF